MYSHDLYRKLLYRLSLEPFFLHNKFSLYIPSAASQIQILLFMSYRNHTMFLLTSVYRCVTSLIYELKIARSEVTSENMSLSIFSFNWLIVHYARFPLDRLFLWTKAERKPLTDTLPQLDYAQFTTKTNNSSAPLPRLNVETLWFSITLKKYNENLQTNTEASNRSIVIELLTKLHVW